MRWNIPITKEKVNKICVEFFNWILQKEKKNLKLCTAQQVLMQHKFLLCGLDYKYSGDNMFNTFNLSVTWKPMLKKMLRSLESLV